MAHSESKLVIIDGPIASGKTTLLSQLERKGYFVKRENCLEWQNYFGKNLVEGHYKDVKVKETWKRLGFTKEEYNHYLEGTRQFQLKVISDYIHHYCEISQYNDLVILERDLDSVSEIFMPLNRDILTIHDYLLVNNLAKTGKEILSKNIPKLKIVPFSINLFFR